MIVPIKSTANSWQSYPNLKKSHEQPFPQNPMKKRTTPRAWKGKNSIRPSFIFICMRARRAPSGHNSVFALASRRSRPFNDVPLHSASAFHYRAHDAAARATALALELCSEGPISGRGKFSTARSSHLPRRCTDICDWTFFHNNCDDVLVLLILGGFVGFFRSAGWLKRKFPFFSFLLWTVENWNWLKRKFI